MKQTLTHLAILGTPSYRAYLCAAQYVILIDALTHYVSHYLAHTHTHTHPDEHNLLNSAQQALDFAFYLFDSRAPAPPDATGESNDPYN